jgi:hypothetical protein
LEEVGGNAEDVVEEVEEIRRNILITILNLIRYIIPGGFVIDWGDYEGQSIKNILFPEKFAK